MNGRKATSKTIIPARRLFCSLLFAALVLTAKAQDARPAPSPEHITIGTRHVLHSYVLGEDRPYLVYLPATYDDSTYAPQRYPVMYLLDGDAHFHSATGVVQFMSSGINGNVQIPEMIVVAIPNTHRTRDLTPTHSTRTLSGKETTAFEESGGGEAFLRFLRDELFPEIESTYRTMPYRLLVGHSFGGLLAAHTLVHHPELFDAFIAIDPSLWWDDDALLHEAEATFTADPDRQATVFISIANNPDIGLGDPLIMRDAERAFAHVLEDANTAHFHSTSRYYEDQDHGSVPLISLYDGLRYVFQNYKQHLGEAMQPPSAITEHFERISQRMGVKVLPPEWFVDKRARFVLNQVKDVDNAVAWYRLNVANYPASYHAHQALGVAYAAKRDTLAAIHQFEQALKLKPDDDAAAGWVKELKGTTEKD